MKKPKQRSKEPGEEGSPEQRQVAGKGEIHSLEWLKEIKE